MMNISVNTSFHGDDSLHLIVPKLDCEKAVNMFPFSQSKS